LEGGKQSQGIPAPQAGDRIIRDTRAGGANSVQAANTLAEALATSGVYIEEHCYNRGGLCLGPGFTTNLDGAGTRAFIWNIKKDAGNPDGCVAGGPSQHNWMLYLNPSWGAPVVDLYVQYKFWMGQTATGGGAAGNIGQFSMGGKDLIVFRFIPGVGSTNDGRFTAAYAGYGGPDRYGAYLWNPVPGEPGTGSGGEVFADTYFDKRDHYNEAVTATYHFKGESAVGARDGVLEVWMNDISVYSRTNLALGTLAWGEAQIGGPTWICPPQDQTEYFWDIVLWERL
jgi:hypothetical protein